MSITPSYSLQAVGITAALVTSGIYFGTTAIAISPLLPLPTNEVLRIFSHLYYTGAVYVVPMALGSAAITATSAYMIPEARTNYSLATAGTLGTMVFTGLWMMPGIHRLLALGQAGKGEVVSREEVLGLVRAWQVQNGIRAALAFAGGVFGILGVSNAL